MNEILDKGVYKVRGEVMEEIIKRCKENDISAQSILYEKYIKQVYRTAYLLTKSKTLGEDISQETFIRVFSKITLFQEGKSFDSWLYTITLNVAKSIIRRQRWVNFFCPLEENEHLDDHNDLALNYEYKEREELIRKVIDGLPYKFKEVIILKYYNNFSQEEIADMLEIPVGTVKSRIHTGLDKIRKIIGNNISIMEVISYE